MTHASTCIEASDHCPVCEGAAISLLLQIDNKAYWKCASCQARFVDRRYLPNSDDEFEHYQLHENEIGDPAYRAFLSKLANPLLKAIAAHQDILDYGSGPGPALAAMLREAGHNVTAYDPYFAPDTGALNKSYDAITCTETAEHFHNPAHEFAKLNGLLRPGGILAVMTCFQTDDAKFASWHYRKDPTHVVFYQEKTFYWIARRYGWTCDIPEKNVVLMRKPET